MNTSDRLVQAIDNTLISIEDYKDSNGISWFYLQAKPVLLELKGKVDNSEKLNLELQNMLSRLIYVADRLSEDSLLSKQLWEINSLMRDYIWEKF